MRDADHRRGGNPRPQWRRTIKRVELTLDTYTETHIEIATSLDDDGSDWRGAIEIGVQHV